MHGVKEKWGSRWKYDGLGERAWGGTMGSERNGYEGFGGRVVIWSRFDSGDKSIGGFGVHGKAPMPMKWHWWCHMMVRRETTITREATIVAAGMILNWHWVPTISKGFMPCSCMLSANSSHSLWLLVDNSLYHSQVFYVPSISSHALHRSGFKKLA